MTKVAESLGVAGVFLYTPTALVIALGNGTDERTYLRRVDSGDIGISKLLAFDAALEELEAGKITIAEAVQKLEDAANAPPVFNLAVALLAAAVACAGVAVIFGGNIIDSVIAGSFGCVIAWATHLFHQSFAQRGWLEPVLGFVAALAAVVIAQWFPVNDRLITLAALILPIPGLTLNCSLRFDSR